MHFGTPELDYWRATLRSEPAILAFLRCSCLRHQKLGPTCWSPGGHLPNITAVWQSCRGRERRAPLDLYSELRRARRCISHPGLVRAVDCHLCLNTWQHHSVYVFFASMAPIVIMLRRITNPVMYSNLGRRQRSLATRWPGRYHELCNFMLHPGPEAQLGLPRTDEFLSKS